MPPSISVRCWYKKNPTPIFTIRVLQIKGLKWKFQGNVRIKVGGVPSHVSWEAYNWIFEDAVEGHGPGRLGSKRWMKKLAQITRKWCEQWGIFAVAKILGDGLGRENMTGMNKKVLFKKGLFESENTIQLSSTSATFPTSIPLQAQIASLKLLFLCLNSWHFEQAQTS